jgi:hypothetical protein
MLRWPWARRVAMARLRRLAMAWGGAGADLGGVLSEGDVADVVQCLDAPVATAVVGQAGGAGDPQGLGGVGEVEAGDGGDLELTRPWPRSRVWSARGCLATAGL